MVVPVECVVRGYLSGSGWKEYRADGHGLRRSRCPPGCGEATTAAGRRSSPRRPRPRPATTRTSRFERMADAGRRRSCRTACRDARSTLYVYGGASTPPTAGSSSPTRSSSGGDCRRAELILIDEVLTPDSSRFWPRDAYRAGRVASRRSTSSSSATGSSRSGWDKNPAARAAARGGGTAPRQVPRGVRAGRGDAVRRYRHLSGVTWAMTPRPTRPRSNGSAGSPA